MKHPLIIMLITSVGRRKENGIKLIIVGQLIVLQAQTFFLAQFFKQKPSFKITHLKYKKYHDSKFTSIQK